MGQSNTGAVLRTEADTAPCYTVKKIPQPRKKKRKTLKLKKRLGSKKHFEATADFSDSGVLDSSVSGTSVVDSRVPVLTTPVVPLADDCMPLAEIPVLDKPVFTESDNFSIQNPDQQLRKQKNLLLFTSVLLFVVLGAALLVIKGNQAEKHETLTNNNIVEPAGVMRVPADTKPAVKPVNKILVQNVVELIGQEKFSQDSTMEAFLTLWQQLDGASRATLNNTPWFLRFVFALQKQSRYYLLSPDSYNVDYTIKYNALLKMAVALGVMDQHGIESSAETYHSKQNELVETIKSEIATIESTNKEQQSGDESIENLNKSFKKRFAVEPGSNAKPRAKIKINVIHRSATDSVSPVNNKIKTVKLVVPAAVTVNEDSTSEAMALDALVNRFTEAYESGNLDELTALFSPAARTNDKNTLADIQKDYADLFNNSSFRLLNIFNLRWMSEHNAMKGIGDYEIGIAMDDSGVARTLHGKIQFVVGKVDNQLRITRLYHLER